MQQKPSMRDPRIVEQEWMTIAEIKARYPWWTNESTYLDQHGVWRDACNERPRFVPLTEKGAPKDAPEAGG